MLEVSSGLDHFLKSFDELPPVVKRSITIFEPSEGEIKNMGVFDAKRFSCFYVLGNATEDDLDYVKTLNFSGMQLEKGTIGEQAKQLYENQQNRKFLIKEQARTLQLQTKSASKVTEPDLNKSIKNTTAEMLVAYSVLELGTEDQAKLAKKALDEIADRGTVADKKKAAQESLQKYKWSYLARYYDLNRADIDGLS